MQHPRLDICVMHRDGYLCNIEGECLYNMQIWTFMHCPRLDVCAISGFWIFVQCPGVDICAISNLDICTTSKVGYWYNIRNEFFEN